MTPPIKKAFAVVITTGLLFLVIATRSGVLVDKSMLPRFLLLAVILLFSWIFLFHKKNLVKNRFFVASFLLFYLWHLLSCLWAVSSSEAIMQSQLVFLSLVLFLTISSLCSTHPGFENVFIKAHMLVLVLSFGLAFYKMSTLVYYDPYKIVSVSANNNLYAGFLLLSMPFVLTGYSLNRGFWKYLSFPVMILSVFFIIILQSRAAYLGLAAGILIAGILLAARYKGAFTKTNLVTGIVSLVFLVAGVLVFYQSLDTIRRNYFMSKIPVWNYIKTYSNASAEELLRMRNAEKAANTQVAAFDFAESYYENANLRMIFWKKSAALMRSNPLVGVGAGNWRLAIPSIAEPPNPEHTIKNYTYSQPHNEWIGILSELGLVGLLLAACVYFIPPGMALRLMASGKNLPQAGTVFYASFIAGFYLFASFDFPLQRVEHNVLLFAALAFLMHRSDYNREGAKTQKSNFLLPEPSRLRVFAVQKTLVIFILIFTVFLACARIRGEYFTLKMFRNEGKNDDNVIHYCREAQSPFYRITPNTLPLDWFEGVAWYRKGDVKTAMHCFQRALKSTPNEVRVLNDYGASLFSLKKPAEAKAVLLHALAIDPFFDDARFNLGAIYYFSGKIDSARFYIDGCRKSQKKTDFLKELDQITAYPQ